MELDELHEGVNQSLSKDQNLEGTRGLIGGTAPQTRESALPTEHGDHVVVYLGPARHSRLQTNPAQGGSRGYRPRTLTPAIQWIASDT
jgi:hypothetical protein